MLLLADQFEEIFRYGQRLDDDLRARAFMEEAAALVRMLLGPVCVLRNYEAGQGGAPDAVDHAIHVVVTMRTEYLDRCGEFDCLLAAINDSFAIAANLEGLNLKRAIVGPAGRRGGAISSKLVDRLIGHAERITFDRLPLLQHVLMRCWRLASDREGKPRMALEDYQATRPLTKGEALSKHADEAFADIEAIGEGRLAEIMFRELTDRPPGVGYDSARDTRRLRSVNEVAAVAGLDGEQWRRLEPVVERFARADTNFVLVKKGPRPDGAAPGGEGDDRSLSPETVLDISHEALIRNWHRLHRWVDAEFDDGNRLRQYADAAARYRQNKAKGDDTPNLARHELEEAREWWFDPDQPHRRRAAWAQRYGFGSDDLAELGNYLQEARRYYQRKDAGERANRLRRKMLVGLALITLVAVFVATPLTIWVRSQMRTEYVEDFRRDIWIAHQILQSPLRTREEDPIGTIFEDWNPDSFRYLFLVKPIMGGDSEVIQSAVAEVKQMANDIIANQEQLTLQALQLTRSGEDGALVRTLVTLPTALSWTDTELRIAFADGTGTYLWDVDSDRAASAKNDGTDRVDEGSELVRICPKADLSDVREIVPVHGSAEWLLVLDAAVVRTSEACAPVPVPPTGGNWRRVMAWGSDLAMLEPSKMHRWHNAEWSEPQDFQLPMEAGENVAALAGAPGEALYAVSNGGRRLHWPDPQQHLAARWDIGLPKQARVRKADFGSHPRGHFMIWLEDPRVSPRLLLLEGTTMVPIDEIDTPELMLWLSQANQAVDEQLKLEAAPVGGKPREPEEAKIPRLVDFDYQCFGERGCWLAAAFTGGGSAPPLLLAKRLHGTHERKKEAVAKLLRE